MADSSYLRFPRLAHNLLAFVAEGAVLLNPVPYQDPAYWKRYLGGRGGQIWYSPDGVALADETAGSDADMGANAFKCYGLGLENHGVDSDHEVPITPRDSNPRPSL